MSHKWTSLGNRIKELRSEKRMTQGKLAEAVGVWTSDVCRWEKGERRPNQITLRSLAQILGTTVQELQQKAGHTPEFDWYLALSDSVDSAADILLDATDEEKEELRRHLLYLRFRSQVIQVKHSTSVPRK